jgi:hypothetical protein
MGESIGRSHYNLSGTATELLLSNHTGGFQPSSVMRQMM